MSFSNTANTSTITTLALCPTILLYLPHLLLWLHLSSFLAQVTLFILFKLLLFLHRLPLCSIFHTTGIAFTKMLITFFCLHFSSFSPFNLSIEFCTTGHASSLSLFLSSKFVRTSTKKCSSPQWSILHFSVHYQVLFGDFHRILHVLIVNIL